MCYRKSFNLISFGCIVLDSCLCKTRYSHLSVYLWMLFLLNQTSSVGNFISFREAMIYVVILMLKSTLFYFPLLLISVGSNKVTSFSGGYCRCHSGPNTGSSSVPTVLQQETEVSLTN